MKITGKKLITMVDELAHVVNVPFFVAAATFEAMLIKDENKLNELRVRRIIGILRQYDDYRKEGTSFHMAIIEQLLDDELNLLKGE